jgi:hypothetical protein
LSREPYVANKQPLKLMAPPARYRGDLDATRHYLELCRDAEAWDPSFSYSRRVSTLIQMFCGARMRCRGMPSSSCRRSSTGTWARACRTD